MAPRISLEQWRALVAVVDAGSYAAAAEALHKTQSSVSYAIGRVEEQLGVAVFRMEGRRAVLTSTGRVLYRRGRALVEEAGRLEEAATRLGAGVEPELGLGVEILFPTWLLLRCLETFSADFPDTRVELYETVLGGGEELLAEGHVDLAVCSQVPAGFLGDPLLPIRFLAVAAPAHPLHALGRALTFDDLRGYRQLFIRDSGVRRDRAGGWEIGGQRWTVSHKATAIRALCMGLGFAWVAEDIIRDELDNGILRPLPLAHGGERWTTLYLAYGDVDGAGPGTHRLAEALRAAAAGRP
ncbi:LysR family transcriptional regulator [Aquisalimonas lutea]|uniref:LysR family transcriptional regulator n=1 Tax=Aquisalimonas lutea TaxID=1327750 RepID=UPI0025B36D7E|nr:LysR family transcriptional regulator [Aquisalimonas lutea]MDN3517033.1 LysR family transcriptional regulator [Aquisalimonas lutea]